MYHSIKEDDKINDSKLNIDDDNMTASLTNLQRIQGYSMHNTKTAIIRAREAEHQPSCKKSVQSQEGYCEKSQEIF